MDVTTLNHVTSADAPQHAILFAGGGSGGHIAPGLAIAERLAAIAPNMRRIFVCSHRAIDRQMLEDEDVVSIPIAALPFSTRPRGLLSFVRAYRTSVKQVREIIRTMHVRHVVALGGFVAAPAARAAKKCGAPSTLVNLDATPGKANRLLARTCTNIYSAVETPGRPNFASSIVGMPVRKRAIAPADVQTCRAKLDLDPKTPVLLITGASQGARSINEMMTALAASNPAMFDGWRILHLTGAGEEAATARAYEQAGVAARVMPFLSDMGLAWGAAELAISRAGASSVAEVAINAVATIFLPYPYHKDMHQRENARPLVDAGCAMMETDLIETADNVREIGPAIEAMLADDDRRAAMRAALRERSPGDAAERIARLIVGESVESTP